MDPKIHINPLFLHTIVGPELLCTHRNSNEDLRLTQKTRIPRYFPQLVLVLIIAFPRSRVRNRHGHQPYWMTIGRESGLNVSNTRERYS